MALKSTKTISSGGVWLVTSRLETGNSWTFFYGVLSLYSREQKPAPSCLGRSLSSCRYHGPKMCKKFEYTDKKGKKIFLISKEIQKGLGAKSHMRKGFLIYISHLWRCTRPLLNSLYMRKTVFYILSVYYQGKRLRTFPILSRAPWPPFLKPTYLP